MKETVTIEGRRIGHAQPPYIVAELSANHNGELNRALDILTAARNAGADAVKIQTYTADTITINNDSEEFTIHGGLWDGRNLYDLYQDAHTPWEWHGPLFEKARELGITMFSSPFDRTAVDLLEDLNAPAYKIASFEAVDLPLISYVARTGKPMIISTGMADREEIAEAVDTARSGGCRDLILLHCISGYPAPAEEYNLRTMADMSHEYDVLTGLSDHTIDNATSVTAVALGAVMIEKHFTLDRHGGGVDDSFSIEPRELKLLCRDAVTAWKALGRISYDRAESERGNDKFRRSLYVVQDVRAGDELTMENVRSIRPGYGMKPKFLHDVLGRKACIDIPRGTALTEEHLN